MHSRCCCMCPSERVQRRYINGENGEKGGWRRGQRDNAAAVDVPLLHKYRRMNLIFPFQTPHSLASVRVCARTAAWDSVSEVSKDWEQKGHKNGGQDDSGFSSALLTCLLICLHQVSRRRIPTS